MEEVPTKSKRCLFILYKFLGTNPTCYLVSISVGLPIRIISCSYAIWASTVPPHGQGVIDQLLLKPDKHFDKLVRFSYFYYMYTGKCCLNLTFFCFSYFYYMYTGQEPEGPGPSMQTRARRWNVETFIASFWVDPCFDKLNWYDNWKCRLKVGGCGIFT